MNVERVSAKNDEPEPVWRELSGNAGWLLYNGNVPFGIKAVVLRLAVGEIAELVGEDLRVADLLIIYQSAPVARLLLDIQ